MDIRDIVKCNKCKYGSAIPTGIICARNKEPMDMSIDDFCSRGKARDKIMTVDTDKLFEDIKDLFNIVGDYSSDLTDSIAHTIIEMIDSQNKNK